MNDDDVMIEVVAKLTRGGQVLTELNANPGARTEAVPTLALGVLARASASIIEMAFTPAERVNHD